MSQYNNKTTGETIVSDFPSQVKGRTFLVTGPSKGGIGASTAEALAHASPHTILLLGRSIAKIQPTIDSIHGIDSSIITKFVPVELSSISSVRAAAKVILDDASVPKIDVVINNAGIMICPYELNADGYELQFATNYLSHFLLTNLLLPKILAAGPGARIVNVSSGGHAFGDINWESLDFNKGKDYEPWKAYGQAKTANILFSVAMNKRLEGKGVKSFALCPGSIRTGLQKHLTSELIDLAVGSYGEQGKTIPEMKSLEQGCSTTLRAALDPSLEVGDSCFLSDCQIQTDPVEIKPYALNKERAERLWSLGEEMVGEKFSL